MERVPSEKTVKVSVIIPVYNSSPYIQQCLDSVTGQSLKELEILCVDDGSSDNSADIVEEAVAKDGRIRLIRQENAGGGAARNRGMKEARGEYLAFLDSDDFIEKDMLKKMYEAARKAAADISICKARRWHEDLKIWSELPGAMREELLPDMRVFSWEDMPDGIFNAFHNWPWNKLFRREFLETEEITYQELHRTNDLYFTCRALVAAERITLVREVLVNYRVGTKSSCQDTNQDYPLDFYDAFRKLKEFLENEGYYQQVEKSFVNHALDGCIANLNSQEKSADQEMLYRQLKGYLLENLGIGRQPASYFHAYNQEAWKALQIVLNKDYKSYLRFRIQELKNERDEAVRREEARADVIYQTVTWKAGKIVTAPIKALAKLIGRV